jgi:hypothetical protein
MTPLILTHTPFILTHSPFILSLSKDVPGQRRLSPSKTERASGQSGAQHPSGGRP